MEKIRNLSIKKTIILYLTVSLVFGFLCGALVMGAAEDAQQMIWHKYIDDEEYERAMASGKDNYEVKVARVNRYDMTEQDVFFSELCDFLQTYSILVLSVISMIVAVVLFYRNKIAIPLAELSAASEMIAKNELEFQVTYSNRDELGRLCGEFDKMRAALAENNRHMWKMIEEEKALRAAIAHDIRSPLAILKGYQEMLIEFVPEGQIEKEKIVEMLDAGRNQIERMEKFIESMRRLPRLEERTMDRSEVTLNFLTRQIESSMKVFEKDTQKKGFVRQKSLDRKLWADKVAVLEVADNLLSNAFRYAAHEVHVDITADEEELSFSVSDDGCGFKEDTDKVTEAYYHSNPQDDLHHFGLGMYISRIYCENHGGRLLVSNDRAGGASVKAVFSTAMQECS